jgi:hypothetical protein
MTDWNKNENTYNCGILKKTLQTLNYAYNIRSWLTNINDVSALGDDR